MKRFKFPVFGLLVTSIVLLGAGCGDDDNPAPVAAFPQNQIQTGSFGSERCFLNRVETQTSGENRYSRAEFTFFPNGTGTAHYTVYSDPNCTVSLSEQNFSFNEVVIQEVGGVPVLRLSDTEDPANATGWFPAFQSNAGYSIDLDFMDGESGPYSLEPTPIQLSGFRENPSQGVLFNRIQSTAASDE